MDSVVEQIIAPALYVVATPIGNLADISQRALHILRGVDLVAAEDTRHSSRLLDHYGVGTSMISLHEHNEQQRSAELIERLQQGVSIALISDAGTPLISDPGYLLVSQVRQAGFRVIPIPGACAVITALSAAGLATDHFLFVGFSPSKSGPRKRFFQRYSQQAETLVFYESPKRLQASLKGLIEVIGGDRPVAIARELTKMHETILQQPLAELLATLQADPVQFRGEIVVLVGGVSRQEVSGLDEKMEQLLALLIDELPVTRAAQVVAQLSDLPKRQVYQRALALQEIRDKQ